jgi:adenine deaminase
MIRVVILVAFLTPPSLIAADTAATPSTTTAYLNGYWFDGHQFSHRTVYVVGDTFSFRRPRKLDATVDLNGAYVVPPFAEAHNHNVELLNDIPKLVATYLEHGIFYVFRAIELPCCRR